MAVSDWVPVSQIGCPVSWASRCASSTFIAAWSQSPSSARSRIAMVRTCESRPRRPCWRSRDSARARNPAASTGSGMAWAAIP